MKEKPYSTLSNVLWTLRLATSRRPVYPVMVLGLLLARLALPLAATLLPTAAVAALTRGGTMGRYLALVGGLMAVYAAGTFFDRWLSCREEMERERFRNVDCMSILMEKTLTMDYCQLETAEGQKLYNASASVVGDSVAGGIDGMLRNVEPWVRNLLGLLCYGGAAAVLDWRILLVLAGMTGANAIVNAIVRRYEKRTEKESRQNHWDRWYYTTQAANPANGKDIRLYRMEKWFQGALLACFQRRWVIRGGLYRRRALGDVSTSLFLLLRDVIAYGVLTASFLAGEVDAAAFTFHLGIISTLTTWLNGFLQADNDLRYFNVTFCSFRNFLNWEGVFTRGGDVKASQVPASPMVELQDVTFTYPGAEKPTIERFSLTLSPGEKIALVGLNGAGKTTLVKLISGLYKPDSGEILVNGVPLEDYDDRLKLVGTVYQDVNLLPLTIGENVAGREDYDRERVWNCLDMAGLREAVEKLPEGLDTYLTQKMESTGVDLSGGQRQRLSFARALYKDAPVLILDEPTAALDPLAEADLYQKYAHETAEKTSIFISHRLSSTQFCHRVVYMENGKIAEEGTHQELMDRGGAYANLFRIQSSYYLDHPDENKEESRYEES